MQTECSAERFDLGVVEGRAVDAAVDTGLVTSDASALLLGSTDRATGMVDRFAARFRDNRRQDLVEHALATLIGQRVFGIAVVIAYLARKALFGSLSQRIFPVHPVGLRKVDHLSRSVRRRRPGAAIAQPRIRRGGYPSGRNDRSPKNENSIAHCTPKRKIAASRLYGPAPAETNMISMNAYRTSGR
jgi:hypothetical protein